MDTDRYCRACADRLAMGDGTVDPCDCDHCPEASRNGDEAEAEPAELSGRGWWMWREA